MDEHGRQRQFEDRFLEQFSTRARLLVGARLTPGHEVDIDSTPAEGADAVRAELRRAEVYDPNVLAEMPGKRTLDVRIVERQWGGLWRAALKKLRVRALVPVADVLAEQSAGPATREMVRLALDRYEVMARRDKPDIVVLGSATGFDAEAKALVATPGPPQVVLAGAREDGGWDIVLPDRLRSSPWAKLFELETEYNRRQRLRYHLEQAGVELDSRGVSIPELAEQLGLSKAETERLVRAACLEDRRLMTVMHNNVVHVCRMPLPLEGEPMSMWTTIRRWLGLKPSASERLKTMTAQRVRLEQQRHEFDQRVERLEAEERKALEEGASAQSDAIRRQVAGKLTRVRKELQRVRAQAAVFTRQIDILGTHIHHMTLSEQGRRMELPNAQELTREAAQAEQIMNELAANAELAAGIEVTGETPETSADEAAIFEEFKQIAASKTGPVTTGPESAAAKSETASPATDEPTRATPAPPTREARRNDEKARPEIG